MNKENMNKEMINIINARVALMSKDIKIQKIIMEFENKKIAQEWLIKAAIATLFGKP